jgi:hypothetical protein
MLCMFPTDNYSIEILYLFKLILDCKDSEEVPKRQSLRDAMFEGKNRKKMCFTVICKFLKN